MCEVIVATPDACVVSLKQICHGWLLCLSLDNACAVADWKKLAVPVQHLHMQPQQQIPSFLARQDPLRNPHIGKLAVKRTQGNRKELLQPERDRQSLSDAL